MTGAEDFLDQLHAAIREAKTIRRRLDRIIVDEIRDARAVAPLIELRKALARIEAVAASAV
ncbi:MAG: hypothetical protein AB7V13_25590 [Pseudorhodoplanes sp.]